MDRLSRSALVGGVVLPLVLVLVLGFLAVAQDASAPAVIALALAPALSAILAPVLWISVVAAVSTAVAMVTSAISFGSDFGEAVPWVLAVIAASAMSVLLASLRPRSIAPVTPDVQTPPPERDPEVWDELTQVPTRDGSQVLDSVLATGQRACVALVDVDDLGGINARYGTGVGDTVLFAVAGRLRYSIEERGASDGDGIVRWGDDQFLIIVTGEPDEVHAALRAMVDKVNLNPMRTDAGLIPVTMCAGVVDRRAGQRMSEAVDLARAALFAAQASGPGHVIFDESPQ